MIEDEANYGAQGLPTRTVQAFSKHFQSNQKVNLVCAARWWVLRHAYFNALDGTMPTSISSSRSRLGTRKWALTKATTGRSQKRSEWMLWLYSRILKAFDTYRKAKVKFSSKFLIKFILSILLAKDSLYHV